MSDGEPTYYVQENGQNGGNGWKDDRCKKYTSLFGICMKTNYRPKKPSDAAKEQAQALEQKGIEIFSVGYEVNSNAEQVLRDVASDNTEKVPQHYFSADAESVAEAFENIATTVNTANAGIDAKITDYLGADIQTNGTGGNEITKEI